MAGSKRKSYRNQPGVIPGLDVRSDTPVRPYSAAIDRGAVGSLRRIDGRSAQGRLIRHMEAGLVELLGGHATITIAQRLLIERICKMRLQLDALDIKLENGSWTPHDQRTYGGLSNAYRLAIVAVEKMKVEGRKLPSIEDAVAAYRRKTGVL